MNKAIYTTAQARERLAELGFTQDPQTAEWKHSDGRIGRLEWVPDYTNDDGKTGTRYYLRLRGHQIVNILGEH